MQTLIILLVILENFTSVTDEYHAAECAAAPPDCSE